MLLRCDVLRLRDRAAAAVPGKAEFSSAALDGGNDLIGDVLVDVKTLFHGLVPFASSHGRDDAAETKENLWNH